VPRWRFGPPPRQHVCRSSHYCSDRCE
jgi:hypothetical protein